MKITNCLTRHPMFTNSDFQYLRKKGLDNRRILEIWDIRLFHGKFPLIRKNNHSCRAI